MSVFASFKEPVTTIVGVPVPMYYAPLLVLMFIAVFWVFFPDSTYVGLLLAGHLWPIWVPPLLAILTWGVWMEFRQAKWWQGQETALFEIRIPREIQKSPLAMEAVLSGMHRKSGEGTFWDRSILGKFRPSFSLEMVSFEGQVRFFVWLRKGMKNALETSFYGQFPEIQIVEVDDYALRFPIDLDKYGVWGMQFALTKDDVYPIKTYIDYGLERDPKEEYKVDPFANVIEFLGSVGKGQQMWIQMVVQVTSKDWRKDGLAEIKKIKEENKKEAGEGQPVPPLSEEQKRQIDAIDRNTSKQAFDVGIRGIYIAEEDKFNGTMIPGLIAIFKQFSSESLNGFKPKGGMTQFDDYPWESNRMKDEVRKNLLAKYKRRGFFRAPDEDHTFSLSTEELASIYRLPSKVVEVPTLPRIQSATSAPPSNLPT
ncbi:MAG: hypothetical protein ACJKSS_02635 [Patescibacteria group bacterium UBA2103]